MSRFIEAIKEGIKNAEDYKANKAEIISVFDEANKVIFEKTNCEDGFLKIKGDNITWCVGFVQECFFDRKCAYPVKLRTPIGEFASDDKDELIENICKIMSSASFGFYARKLMK